MIHITVKTEIPLHFYKRSWKLTHHNQTGKTRINIDSGGDSPGKENGLKDDKMVDHFF